MMHNDITDAFQRVLGRDLDALMSNIIWPESDGYRVFDRYLLVVTATGCSVRVDPDLQWDFTSSRSALTWCVAHKYNQLQVCADVLASDQRRRSLRDDIEVSRQLMERSRDWLNRSVLESKISHKRSLLIQQENRLEKMAALAKYWQIRGFNHEIARTRRPAPVATNRRSDRKSLRSKN